MRKILFLLWSFFVIFSLCFVSNDSFAASTAVRGFNQSGTWVKDIKINLLPRIEKVGVSGYSERRYMISNRGKKDKKVILNLVSGINHFTKIVTVPVNSTVSASLCVNSPFLRSLELKVGINGVEYDGREDFRIIDDISISYDKILLVGADVKGDLSKFPFTNSSRHRYHSSFNSIKLNFSSESLSDNWLAYSSYNAMLFTENEINLMPKKVKIAINKYVEMGGQLIIETTRNIPETTRLRRSDNIHKKDVIYGTIYYINVPFKKLPAKDATMLHQLLGKNILDRVVNEPDFPVLKESAISAAVLVVLILLFAIITGPLALIYLSLKKRKILMIWFTPIVSVAFSLFIIIYSITSEGLYSRVHSVSYTYLDENNQRAATVAVHGYYCPIPPSTLQYDNDCEVISATKGERFEHSIDWTGEQLLTSGWIAPRVSSYLKIRKNDDRRERLSIIKQTANELEIVNGLGADLEKICVKTSNGRLYFSDKKISAGEKATLKYYPKALLKNEICIPQNAYKSILNINININIKYKKLSEKPEGRVKFLPNGTYIGILKKSPFLKIGIDEDSMTSDINQENFIYGILKKEGKQK